MQTYTSIQAPTRRELERLVRCVADADGAGVPERDDLIEYLATFAGGGRAQSLPVEYAQALLLRAAGRATRAGFVPTLVRCALALNAIGPQL
jgi:hypothetical protein